MNNKNNYSAFDTAVYYLSFKDRTVKELTDKLKEKDYNEEDIEGVVSKLLNYGYLDDERYAYAYIKNHRNRKGMGLIKRELAFKGIDRDIINNVLEASDFDADSETVVVRDIYNRRFFSLEMSDEKQKKRIFSYFQRRGFSFEVISRAMRDIGDV